MTETLVPGTRFGGYEILGVIGAGGMGRVFRARDVTLDRQVALKTLSEEYAGDPRFVQRFLKEARAAASLNHPNIVQIYGFGEERSTYYLAMELVDGRSLGFYLRTTHWPESEAILIVRQACQGLAAAHDLGIVHRDIKPENLILTQRGEIKLVDLGIAKRVGDDQSLTQSGSAMGTPHYISPEQVRGERDVDARADIYSLGATLYHLVTGHTPYSGSSGAHVMSMHLTAPLPDPRTLAPGLSDGLCRVLRKMMAKEREERYPNVRALDLDLYQLQIGGTPRPAEPRATAIGTTEQRGLQETVLDSPAAELDAAILARVENHLTAAIGPLARVLVRKAARGAGSLEALCAELAAQIPAGRERDTFARRCLACEEAAASGERSRIDESRAAATPPPATPARGTVAPSAPLPAAWSEAEIARVESELAQRIGPLAKVLVRKAARSSASLAELVARLEPQIGDPPARASFRRTLLGSG
ncbi:MAG: serine/threonine-protein kinase [Thermoanaerobaculia bacterium]